MEPVHSRMKIIKNELGRVGRTSLGKILRTKIRETSLRL
jgi:hypothetical protein